MSAAEAWLDSIAEQARRLALDAGRIDPKELAGLRKIDRYLAGLLIEVESSKAVPS